MYTLQSNIGGEGKRKPFTSGVCLLCNQIGQPEIFDR